MHPNKKLIANFYGRVGSFVSSNNSLNVAVYLNSDHTVTAKYNGKFERQFENFSAFLNDFEKLNPHWYAYNHKEIDANYKSIIENKLHNTFSQLFYNLQNQIDSLGNWNIINQTDSEMDPDHFFFPNAIQNVILNNCNFDLIRTQLAQNKPVFVKEEKPEPIILSQMWNGYCPESMLKGKEVKMRLNRNDFFESEETGLQIAVISGVHAIILKFRGQGDFRTEATYAHDIENGELLSPQNTKSPPFNYPAEIFAESIDIENYIKSID